MLLVFWGEGFFLYKNAKTARWKYQDALKIKIKIITFDLVDTTYFVKKKKIGLIFCNFWYFLFCL